MRLILVGDLDEHRLFTQCLRCRHRRRASSLAEDVEVVREEGAAFSEEQRRRFQGDARRNLARSLLFRWDWALEDRRTGAPALAGRLSPCTIWALVHEICILDDRWQGPAV